MIGDGENNVKTLEAREEGFFHNPLAIQAPSNKFIIWNVWPAMRKSIIVTIN